jgi:hypothetical protein
VQAHGGTVAVRSTPGAGSVFEILLPLGVASNPPSARPGTPARRLEADLLNG